MAEHVDSMLVVGVAVFFALMGLVALATPDRVLAFFGTRALTRDTRNEVRAVYGGFGLAIAGALCATFFLPSLRDGTLMTVTLALLGMAGGRLVAVVVDGSPGVFPWLFFGVEIALAAALLAAQ